mmetsp:Transcript_5901/g.23916  ORF Transcript_5901/g.23916 Transcript_5901/m.23916 type:complete len:247 (-) Transcript_5901:665-1405(-)
MPLSYPARMLNASTSTSSGGRQCASTSRSIRVSVASASAPASASAVKTSAKYGVRPGLAANKYLHTCFNLPSLNFSRSLTLRRLLARTRVPGSASPANASAANARRNRVIAAGSFSSSSPKRNAPSLSVSAFAKFSDFSNSSPPCLRLSANAALIRRKMSGSCTAPLPIITPAQLVRSTSSNAFAGLVTSPFPTTGTSSKSTANAMSSHRAFPVYPSLRVRGCSVTNCAPPACAASRFSFSKPRSS